VNQKILSVYLDTCFLVRRFISYLKKILIGRPIASEHIDYCASRMIVINSQILLFFFEKIFDESVKYEREKRE